MEPEDILYLVTIENSIGRTDKTIELMMTLADQKPVFNAEERQHLVLTFKTAVDPIRETIRILNDSYLREESQEYAELIRQTTEESIRELNEICNKGINLINDILLPACEDAQGTAFFQKLLGDFYRYMVEFATDATLEDIKAKAEKAYVSATETCKQSLIPADPTSLGVVLNYAVFKYDSKKEKESANHMIEEAIKGFQATAEQLPENSKKESYNIVNTMQKNLIAWNPDKLPDEEEEDEDEEETAEQKEGEAKDEE